MNACKRLETVLNKSTRRIIGLMSGMSMDGVDLALVEISGEFPALSIKLEHADFLPYSADLKQDLESVRMSGSSAQVSELNFRVAGAFAECVNRFLKTQKIPADSIDAIGSHGQTIYHKSGAAADYPSTLQIGSGSVIAERTGILTVSNFRERDVAAGGTGAPLVPLVDYLLFRRPSEVVALNNLGSISNVTVVTPEIEGLLAFDTGPANMPIDFFAARVPGNAERIDTDGKYSGAGNVIEPMLARLLANPFFQVAPPKAAGYGEFGPPVLEVIHREFASAAPADLVRTAVEFSARSLADAYRQFVLPKFAVLKHVRLSGGGAKHPLLVRRIAELLPELQVESLDRSDRRFSDAKEALAFAVLANETLSGRPGNVPQVTGAARPVILGDLST